MVLRVSVASRILHASLILVGGYVSSLPVVSLQVQPQAQSPTEPQTLTVQQIFSQPRIEGSRPAGAVISPDEKWVAYTWNAAGYTDRRDLYVVLTKGGKPRPLTAFHLNAPDDSLLQQWRELRETYSTADNDDLEELPEYFEDPAAGAVTALRWAPDSKRIAFVDAGDIFVVEVSRGKLQRLTRSPVAESQPRWSPDGRYLSYQRGNSIWISQLDTPMQVQVNDLVQSGESLQRYEWSPDGRWLAFTTQGNAGRGELLVANYLPDHVKDESVREGYPTQRVGVVDLNGWLSADAATRMHDREALTVTFLDFGEGKHPNVNVLKWSADSRWLLWNEILPDMQTRKIHIADPHKSEVHTVFSETDSLWKEEYDWGLTDAPVLFWSEEGNAIYTTTEQTGFQHLVRLPVEQALQSEDGLTPTDLQALTSGDWTVDWAHGLPGSSNILLLTSRQTTTQRHLELLDTASGTLVTLQTAEGKNSFPQIGDKGKTVVYQHSRFNVPYDLWSLETRTGRQPRELTKTVPERFDAIDWNVPEFVKLSSKDGTPLRGLLYRPDDFDPQQSYPVVVFVHGAGIMQNVIDGWTAYAPNYKFHTVLTQRGFVVFEVDYRGSLGYGREFRAGTTTFIGGKDLEDELAGVEFLKALPFVDAAHIGIYGGSYGGFMALMALFHAPDDYAAGAALRFVADWENYYRGNPWYCIKRLGKPEDNPAAYYRSSPIHFAENLQDPLLLLHGMRDNNVHFQDAAQLVERLIRLGKDFDLMVYPAERHGFTRASSWIDEYQRILDFFVEHLQP
jgi:dipeptidyl aminopeptidase/acylaminoacyl peptidase